MKNRLSNYKKIAAGFLIFVFAIECRFFDTLFYGAYQIQKKVISRKIFSQLEDYFFITKESQYGKIYFTYHDKEYSQMILSMVDMYYPLIAKDFGCDADKTITIIVYPTKKLMGKVVGTGEEQIPMGAYYGGILNILSPELWLEGEEDSTKIDRFLEEGPMIHEIVHLVLDQKLKGVYDLWFTEGVALFYEKKYTGFEWRPDLKEKSADITWKDLKTSFRMLEEAKAYRKSYDIICGIAEDGGELQLQDMISKMAKGKSFEEVYESQKKKENK